MFGTKQFRQNPIQNQQVPMQNQQNPVQNRIKKTNDNKSKNIFFDKAYEDARKDNNDYRFNEFMQDVKEIGPFDQKGLKKRFNQRKNFSEDKREFDMQNPERLRQEDIYNEEKINRGIATAKAGREQGRAEGALRAEQALTRKVPGLDPELRKTLQYEANRGINREQQSAARGLIGNQAQRGIVGKGGVGYAQARELQKAAAEARGNSERDLVKLNQDITGKQRAQAFGIEEGEAVQNQLDRQIERDAIDYDKERKNQREFQRKLSQQFNSI